MRKKKNELEFITTLTELQKIRLKEIRNIIENSKTLVSTCRGVFVKLKDTWKESSFIYQRIVPDIDLIEPTASSILEDLESIPTLIRNILEEKE